MVCPAPRFSTLGALIDSLSPSRAQRQIKHSDRRCCGEQKHRVVANTVEVTNLVCPGLALVLHLACHIHNDAACKHNQHEHKENGLHGSPLLCESVDYSTPNCCCRGAGMGA